MLREVFLAVRAARRCALHVDGPGPSVLPSALDGVRFERGEVVHFRNMVTRREDGDE